jgi:hypothetical protein
MCWQTTLWRGCTRERGRKSHESSNGIPCKSAQCFASFSASAMNCLMLLTLSQSSGVCATRCNHKTRTTAPPRCEVYAVVSDKNFITENGLDIPRARVELDGLLDLLKGGRLRGRLILATAQGREDSTAGGEESTKSEVLVLNGTAEDNAVCNFVCPILKVLLSWPSQVVVE